MPVSYKLAGVFSLGLSWHACGCICLPRRGDIGAALRRNQTDKFPVKEIAAFEAGGLILKTDNRDQLCVCIRHME